MPAPPLASPSSMYSGPPPPYSYPSSTASSIVGGHTNGYISPPQEHRKLCEDTKDLQQVNRQSLPSIHEALNRDHPISISSLLTKTSAPPPPSNTAHYTTHRSPTSPTYHSYRDAPSTLPPTTPSRTQSSPHFTESMPRAHHSPRAAYDTINGRLPSSTTREEPYPPMMPPQTISSPLTVSRPPMPVSSLRHSSPAYESIPRPSPAMNPPPSSAYVSYSAPYSHPPPMPTIGASYQPPSPSHPPTWRYGENGYDRGGDDEHRKNGVIKDHLIKSAYGEAVKRHLDNFDLETSLNEIAEGSGRALDFSRHYSARAHQTQRSGPVAGSMPSIPECDELMEYQRRVLESMQRIKEVMLAQQQALVQQRDYENTYKTSGEPEDDATSFHDKVEGSGGFAGADPKKRRG
ncbi:MAG: hypothetical protein Q9174_004218, partial [Haloplaca sp. 1 TL-2023]